VANTTYHIALIRKGATYTFFINGNNIVSYISPIPYYISDSNSVISIGYLNPTGFSSFNGIIDELRITNGIARYTTNFAITSISFPSISVPFNINLLSQAQSLTSETTVSVASSTPSNIIVDQYYYKVVALMHFNDATFIDNSIYNAPSSNINTTFSLIQSVPISTLSVGSAYFNGNSQLIYNSSPLYLFVINSFTIEFFIYASNNNSLVFLTSSSTTYISNLITVSINNNNNIQIQFNSSIGNLISNKVIILNKWYNICIVNNNSYYQSIISLYINGILDNSLNNLMQTSIDSTYTKLYLIFGSINGTTLNNFQGYLKEFRITNGIARYNSNYTIQSTSFANGNTGILTTIKETCDLYWYYVTLLLHFDGINTILKDSSNYNMIPSSISFPDMTIYSFNRFVFGNSSLYLNNGYIVYPSSSNFALNNNNFTIEFWISYDNSISPFRILGNINWYIGLNSNNNITFVISNNTTSSIISFIGTSILVQRIWYNIAIVRNKNNILIFVNGNLESSNIFTYQIDDGTNWPLYIGTDGSTNNKCNDYIDELRITNGISRYTTNYSMATSQFSSTAPTQLLTLPTVEEIFTNTNVLVNNTPQLSISITYYPVSSMTANTTVITGTSYGTGTYIISASNTSANAAYNAFDNVSTTSWLSGASYTTTSSAFSTTVSGTTRSGEWLQIQLPTTIILKYYSIQASSSAATTKSPASFVIAGSQDATNWFLIDIRSGLSWGNNSMVQTFTISNNILAYNYYRLIGISLVSAGASTALEIGEMKLYGYNK
jgi:hypothetical protein